MDNPSNPTHDTRSNSETPGDPIEAALIQFQEDWFSGKRVDPDAFCRKHPECGSELRKEIEGFLSVVKKLPSNVEEDKQYQKARGDSEVKSGKVLGDFSIIREIGKGGMGKVYEAEQISLNRKVALKILPAHLSFSRDAVWKFQREAEAGGRQCHKGIVGVYAVGEHEGHHYIAQELIEGSFTLADRMDDLRKFGQRLPGYFRGVAKLMVEIADALQHAHDSGVIHRDVKPSNILLTKDDQPKVTDFGLAKIEDALALSRTGEFAGTPFYMSPEQAASRRIGIDHRTDIFSLGVTLYEMLTLVRPFDGETSQEVLKKILLHEPRNPRKKDSRIPMDLSVICLKAMEKRPEARYPTMADFKEDLCRYLSGDVISAKPAGRLARIVKWTRRNPSKSAALIVAVLLLMSIWPLWTLLQERNKLVQDERVRIILQELFDIRNRFTSESSIIAVSAIPSINQPAGFDLMKWEVDHGAISEEYINAFERFGINLFGEDCVSEITESLLRNQVSDTELYQGLLSGLYDLAYHLEQAGIAYAALIDNGAELKWASDDRKSKWLSIQKTNADLVRLWPHLMQILEICENDTWRQDVYKAWLKWLNDRKSIFTEMIIKDQLMERPGRDLDWLASYVLRIHGEEEALPILIEAVMKSPDLYWPHMRIGQVALKRNDVETAIEQFKIALALSPESTGTRYELGLAQLTANKTGLAEINWERILELDPEHVPAMNGLGVLYSRSRKYKDAIEILERAVEIAPDEIAASVAILSLGGVYVSMGKNDEAIKMYKNSISKNPMIVAAYSNLGLIYLKQGEFQKSLEYGQKAVEIQPDAPYTHWNLGAVLHKLKRAEESVIEYEKAIELFPHMPPWQYGAGRLYDLYVDYGRTFGDRGKWAEAVEQFKKAIEVDIKKSLGYSELGNALWNMGKHDEAMKSFENAIQRNPKDAIALNGIGLLETSKNNDEKGIEYFALAAEANPRYAKAIGNLGCTLYSIGAYEQAIPHLKKAVELDPTLAPAHNTLGLSLWRLGRLDGAVDALNGALEIKPWGGTYCNLAWVYCKMGDLDRALQCMKKGHLMGMLDRAWSYPSKRWIEEIENTISMQSVLLGIRKPADIKEEYDLAVAASRCGQARRSTLIYKSVFSKIENDGETTKDTKIILNFKDYFEAAATATMASRGLGAVYEPIEAQFGEDGNPLIDSSGNPSFTHQINWMELRSLSEVLTEDESRRYLEWALEWLDEGFQMCHKAMKTEDPSARISIIRNVKVGILGDSRFGYLRYAPEDAQWADRAKLFFKSVKETLNAW